MGFLGVYMISLGEAKIQLNIEDDNEDDFISSLILSAQGSVEQELGIDIYHLRSEVPAEAESVIVTEELKATKVESLKMAVKLVLSTMYLHRESTTDLNLSENPAFESCIKGFRKVYIG